MANKFAWASIGENGKATGGKRGDQTGKEVKVADYYNFGQNKVIRFKVRKYGKAAASIAKVIAKDDSAGYNQNDRGSLYAACAELGWNATKIKSAIKKGTFPKCNCDCSAFVATCINIAYGKKMVPCFTTATMERETVKKYPKQFEVISVKKAETGFLRGDCPLRAGHHVIINV